MTIDFASAGADPFRRVLTVGELVRQVAHLLERSFPLSWVAGEISNLVRAGSGHWYFSLKDRDAQVRCVMFRNRNQNVDWMPRDGDRVEARALPGLYAQRGDFQLQVEQMRRAGAGALYEAFVRIKAVLEEAGLFDPARKRGLPAHPRRIGVVTSLQAAALRDVLTTLARRAPHVEVVVFPAPVQGTDAPARIVEALAAASAAGATHAIELVLLVRGGGSIEDLWAFNDERVARAIAATAIPVVSGVGHETDFTIADFVADLRAATPTAAAEMASPDAGALSTKLARYRSAMTRANDRRMNVFAQRVDEASRRLRSPRQRLDDARECLVRLTQRLVNAEGRQHLLAARALSDRTDRLRAALPSIALLAGRLGATRVGLMRSVTRRVQIADGRTLGARQRLVLLDPKGILRRGYAIALDRDGSSIRDATGLAEGDEVTVEVARGRFVSTVVGSGFE